MDEKENFLKQQLFYEVPPPSIDHRLYTETMSRGDFSPSAWKRGPAIRGKDHEKYYELKWPEFTLMGTSWRVIARLAWKTRFGSALPGRWLQLYVQPMTRGQLPEGFRITLAFCLYSKVESRYLTTKYRVFDRCIIEPGTIFGFSEFTRMSDNQEALLSLPLHCNNICAYVRLESPSRTKYQLEPLNPKWISPREWSIEHQMTMLGRDYQDSEPFEFGEGVWRLFYCRYPKQRLLLQRMPGDEAGTMAVEFTLLGINNGIMFRESLAHTFNEGFNDWGITNNDLHRCSHVGIMITYFDTTEEHEQTWARLAQLLSPGRSNRVRGQDRQQDFCSEKQNYVQPTSTPIYPREKQPPYSQLSQNIPAQTRNLSEKPPISQEPQPVTSYSGPQGKTLDRADAYFAGINELVAQAQPPTQPKPQSEAQARTQEHLAQIQAMEQSGQPASDAPPAYSL